MWLHPFSASFADMRPMHSKSTIIYKEYIIEEQFRQLVPYILSLNLKQFNCSCGVLCSRHETVCNYLPDIFQDMGFETLLHPYILQNVYEEIFWYHHIKTETVHG